MRGTVEERFTAKVNKKGRRMPGMKTRCHEWTGTLSTGGYPLFRVATDESMQRAHRVSYILFKGKIPKGKGYHGVCVCHKCDNPLCVRPSHLFLGTHTDNMKDMVAKGRGKDQKGSGNGHAKLTDDDVRAIRKDTRTQVVIGKAYDIPQTQVSRIKLGQAWTHVV